MYLIINCFKKPSLWNIQLDVPSVHLFGLVWTLCCLLIFGICFGELHFKTTIILLLLVTENRSKFIVNQLVLPVFMNSKYILLLAKLQGESDLLSQTKSMSVSSAEPHQVPCRQHSAIGHQAGAGKKGKNKICMVFDFHKYMYKTVEGCHRNFIPPYHYIIIIRITGI